MYRCQDRWKGTTLLAFFVLTFIVSWGCFFGAAALAGPNAGPELANSPVLLLGVFAPALVGVGVTAWTSGRAGTVALLRRIVRAPADPRWYLFALGFIAVLKLSAALVFRLGWGAWPAFGADRPLVLVIATLLSTPVQAGEEIGWRGVALPRLSARFGLGPGSIVLGIVWTAWHLPFFYISAADTYQQSFTLYLGGVTAFSVALAWLYWRTGGSLLMTMMLHAAYNNTKDIVPSAAQVPIGWITAGLLWLCAAYFLARMRGVAQLDRSPARAAAMVS